MTEPLRIAAIGDSLTQGFMSGAISNTSMSFPAMIARALGISIPGDFKVPRFPGPGLPLNIEEALHSIGEKLGADLKGTRTWSWRFPRRFADFCDMVEDLYERGSGSGPAQFGGTYNNLAVWGFRVQDSYTITPALCESVIEDEEGFIHDDFLGLPSAPMYRTARRVLNPKLSPSRDNVTQIGALKNLVKANDGLDALILYLGSNDCLGTVLGLEIRDMKDHSGAITDDPVERRRLWNLTSKKQFKKDYRELAQRVQDAIPDTTKVFVATVPHVTIPPVTRGLGKFADGYFEHYGRFFQSNEHFSTWFHSHITGEEARTIDDRIDDFNAIIRETAEDNGWFVVEVSQALGTLAVRRQRAELNPGKPLRDYFARLGISDHPLLNLDPVPSILTYSTSEFGKRVGGGLFSLDGVHPSTIGYGLVADMFLREMQEAGLPNADPARLDWRQVILSDQLLNSAPMIWDDVVEVAQNNPLLWDTLFKVMG